MFIDFVCLGFFCRGVLGVFKGHRLLVCRVFGFMGGLGFVLGFLKGVYLGLLTGLRLFRACLHTLEPTLLGLLGLISVCNS